MNVDLPEPDGPDEEDELALLDVDVGVAQGDDVALVDLGDVLELDHEGQQRPAVSGEGGRDPGGLRRGRRLRGEHVTIGRLGGPAPPTAASEG